MIRSLLLSISLVPAALIGAVAKGDSIEWKIVSTDTKTASFIQKATFNEKLSTDRFEEQLNKLIAKGTVTKCMELKKDKPAVEIDKTIPTRGGTEGDWIAVVNAPWPSKTSNYIQHVEIATPKGVVSDEQTVLMAAHCPTMVPNRWVVGARWSIRKQSILLLQKLITDSPELPEYQQYYHFPCFMEILSQKQTRSRLNPARVSQAELDKLAAELADRSPDSVGVSVNHAVGDRMGGGIGKLGSKTLDGWNFDCEATASIDRTWIDFSARLTTSMGGLAPVGEWCLLRDSSEPAKLGAVCLVKLTPLSPAPSAPAAPPRRPGQDGFATKKTTLIVHPGFRRMIAPADPHKQLIQLFEQAGCKLASPTLVFIEGKLIVPSSTTANDDTATLETFLRGKLLMWDQFAEWRASNPEEFAAQR